MSLPGDPSPQRAREKKPQEKCVFRVDLRQTFSFLKGPASCTYTHRFRVTSPFSDGASPGFLPVTAIQGPAAVNLFTQPLGLPADPCFTPPDSGPPFAMHVEVGRNLSFSQGRGVAVQCVASKMQKLREERSGHNDVLLR